MAPKETEESKAFQVLMAQWETLETLEWKECKDQLVKRWENNVIPVSAWYSLALCNQGMKGEPGDVLESGARVSCQQLIIWSSVIRALLLLQGLPGKTGPPGEKGEPGEAVRFNHINNSEIYISFSRFPVWSVTRLSLQY